MKYVKVINLTNAFGTADYKGLEIEMIIPGSQVYDITLSVFIGATTEEALPIHADLIEITEAEYKSKKSEIIASYPLPKEEQNAVKISELEAQLKTAQEDNANLVTMLVEGGII